VRLTEINRTRGITVIVIEQNVVKRIFLGH
jgi:hypothetical protein